MNSPTNTGRKWLISTCRGRVQHLRKHLPTWLELMPTWEPCIVCCDDRVAFEYAAGELMLAKRGLCLFVEQGPYFNRLEAIRLGVGVIQSGCVPAGQAFTARVFAPDPIADNDLVAMWDADTVALRTTERALEHLGSGDVAISGSTLRSEMGVLVASLHLLRLGLEVVPPGMFVDYGHEDCALRLGVWVHHRKPFERLRPCWSRANHSDRMRRENYRDLMDVSGSRNGRALAELVALLMRPEEIPQWRADCYLPGTYQSKPAVSRAG